MNNILRSTKQIAEPRAGVGLRRESVLFIFARRINLAWQTIRELKCKNVAFDVLGLLLVYANLAIIFHPRAMRYAGSGLPVPDSAYNSLLVFGVFSYFETNNSEMTIWGIARNPENKNTYWKQLPTDDYFPFGRGEQNSRLWASHHYRDSGKQGHWEAWKSVGRKILEKHNREHPSDPVEKVAFQSLSWPRSPEGFYANENRSRGSKRVWTLAETNLFSDDP